jgi:hypothetical protein
MKPQSNALVPRGAAWKNKTRIVLPARWKLSASVGHRRLSYKLSNKYDTVEELKNAALKTLNNRNSCRGHRKSGSGGVG